MTREQLINGLKKRLVDSSIEEYKEWFSSDNISRNDETDAIEFYKDLSETQREVFLKIIKQIEIDTMADFLAFLDGIYWIEGQTEDMRLVCLDNPEEKLNEDLTDLFLSLIHVWKR